MSKNDNKETDPFKKGGRYLLKPKKNNNLYEIILLEISEEAYKIRWHDVYNKYSDEWHIKNDILEKYIIFEELPFDRDNLNQMEFNPNEFSNPQEYYEKTTIPCPVCNQTGEIDDHELTAGKKTCPTCWGSGKKWKT